MEWIVTECVVAAGCQLEISAALIGEDVLLCLQGGERPHLGCVVQTEPRESLSGDGSVSATSSVLNFPGHKDEVVCRWMAEKISKELGKSPLSSPTAAGIPITCPFCRKIGW